MSSIGPQLPPHLTKRKRTPDDDAEDPPPSPNKHPRNAVGPSKNDDEIDLDDSASESDGYGPSAPAPAPKPSVGPTLPPFSSKDEVDLASGSDSDTGPAPPPAAAQPDDHDTSDSDDGFGPAPPTTSNAPKRSIGPSLPAADEPDAAPQRDSWMLAPPPSSSGYAERDPTKMRSRKFASAAPGKPAPSAASGQPSAIWTETPEEKLRRLQDSVLGRGDAGAADGGQPAAAASSSATKQDKEEEEERARRIAASVEAQRGKSLYDDHQKRRDRAGADKVEEDDPSKRGFDREKDMALGGKIGTAQRRELMNKAANFGGRFQKGSYL